MKISVGHYLIFYVIKIHSNHCNRVVVLDAFCMTSLFIPLVLVTFGINNGRLMYPHSVNHGCYPNETVSHALPQMVPYDQHKLLKTLTWQRWSSWLLCHCQLWRLLRGCQAECFIIIGCSEGCQAFGAANNDIAPSLTRFVSVTSYRIIKQSIIQPATHCIFQAGTENQ